MNTEQLWIIRTAESNYKLHNMNKKECIAYLIDCGIAEPVAKERVKRFIR